MSRKQYNSAADRRWQQRYQRIQERKENVFDVETPRKERRREKKALYKTSGIDIERMTPDKVAILCTSPSQVRQLYYAVSKWMPEYTRYRSVEVLEDGFYFCKDATVGIVTEDFAFFDETSIRVDSKSYFIRRGFEIIEFYELLPVKDLGKVRESTETLDFLLGI